MLKTNHTEVAVIGGGIVGSAIAYYLAKDKRKVALFEEREIGSRSTSAAAGMLGAHSEYKEFQHVYSFARSSQLLYKELYHELKEQTGIDFEMKKGGLLQLAFTSEEREERNSLMQLPDIEWLTREEAKRKVPLLTDQIIGASFLKEDVHVTPAIASNSFSKGAFLFGAEIYEFTKVLSVVNEHSHYKVNTTQGSYTADQVVIASGVWSNYFFQQTGLMNAIIPVKGECIAVLNDQLPLAHSIFHDQHYIVPRNNNELIVGATKRWNDWNEEPTLEGIEMVIKKAKEMLPSIQGMRWLRSWAGLRPQTFDSFPFIGEHPEQKGLYFAAGHQRNGILLAPGTGRMIADLISGNSVNSEWVEAFKIDRLPSAVSTGRG